MVMAFSSLSLSGLSINLTVPSLPLSPAFCRMPGVPGVIGVAGLVGLVFNLPFGGRPFVIGRTPFVAAPAYPAGSARLPSSFGWRYSVYRGMRLVLNSSLSGMRISRKASISNCGPTLVDVR